MQGDDAGAKADHEARQQTDKSLRVERTRADAGDAERRATVEQEADKVVRTARRVADDALQDARNEADLVQPRSAADAASVDRERARADVHLEDERSNEDAALHEQRTARGRYLADFLVAEREATDADLTRERRYSDTLISTRDEFLATVSHDMRDMLGGLSLNAGLLLKESPEGASGDKIRRRAAASQRLVARMTRLVNDLLDIASIEAGKLSLLSGSVEIGQMLRETLEAFGPLAVAKGVALDAVAAVPPRDIQWDGGRVLQVLANLVSNAIKFTPSGGRVSISVQTRGNDIEFSVSDTGVGIPEPLLSAVFERYRQISRDRRGLGLGLHISKCIVEAHGGRMWVESKVGVGSTFRYALPASPTAAVAT